MVTEALTSLKNTLEEAIAGAPNRARIWHEIDRSLRSNELKL
jgi:hypothetical protein